MTIFNAIRKVAKENGIELDRSTLNKVAGTLKTAGVRTPSEDLVRLAIQSTQPKPDKTRTAEAESNTDESGFKKIDDSLQKGHCPRCGKKMADVLLADYTPAKFCKGECRITLWEVDED